MSTGLLLGCASAPLNHGHVGKGFIDIGAASFAVFSQDSEAFAVYLGGEPSSVTDWILPAAQKAIERATGCPISPNSMTQQGKTISAQLRCAQNISIFVRSQAKVRGKTARSGVGPPARHLAELRAENVAEEPRKNNLKQ